MCIQMSLYHLFTFHYPQGRELLGEQGILPMQGHSVIHNSNYLTDCASEFLQGQRFVESPTVFHIAADDTTLLAAASGGVLLGAHLVH